MCMQWIVWFTLLVQAGFDVSSVRLAPKGCPSSQSPGRISQCATLEARIQIAYNLAAHGPHRRQGRRLQIIGGPEWVRSDFYEISAETNAAAPPDQMYGPMMQVLLEDRFKLRIRRQKRDAPVYVLTVAKSGLKLKRLKDGACTPLDANHPSDDPTQECGYFVARPGEIFSLDSRGETMADFADDLSNLASDRVVVDETGVTGLFNIHLEFAKGDSGAGPSLFTALRELGLQVTAARRPVEVLVIDHVERPDAN